MILNDLPKIMFICLVCTIIIELIIGLIIGIRKKKDIINLILVNVITNPLVTSIPVYFNIYYGLNYRNISLGILEVLTFVFEGFIYYKFLEYKKLNGFIVSLMLNLGSYFIGDILGKIIF